MTITIREPHIHQALAQPALSNCLLAAAGNGVCGYRFITINGVDYFLPQKARPVTHLFDDIRHVAKHKPELKQRLMQRLRKMLPLQLELIPV